MNFVISRKAGDRAAFVFFDTVVWALRSASILLVYSGLKQVLRFAQDDKSFFVWIEGVIAYC